MALPVQSKKKGSREKMRLPVTCYQTEGKNLLWKIFVKRRFRKLENWFET